MEIKDKIELHISYGLSTVHVQDVINKKYYEEDFTTSRFSWLHMYFQHKAEKRAIKKAIKFIGRKIFTYHQEMMTPSTL